MADVLAKLYFTSIESAYASLALFLPPRKKIN
jgi:hypothetical protein